MDVRKIENFLDAAGVADRHLRDIILRSHSRRWPTWRAISMLREGHDIIEVAEWCRIKRGERFVVIRWNIITLGVQWHSFSTLREARS